MSIKLTPMTKTAIKICGITKEVQAVEIAKLRVQAIGVIAVMNSPRYVSAKIRSKIFSEIHRVSDEIDKVVVVANPKDQEIIDIVDCINPPSVIQLHGDESLNRCKEIKAEHPEIKLWKAFRLSDPGELNKVNEYQECIDAFLVDAWDPNQLGGTGKRIPISWLENIKFRRPLWIAGGISPACIPELIQKINPFGIDASSRLEIYPGLKDIKKVQELVKKVTLCQPQKS